MQIKITGRITAYPLIATIKKIESKCHWGCRENGTLLQLVGLWNDATITENNMEVPQKIQNRIFWCKM